MYAAAAGKSTLGIPKAVGREFVGAPKAKSLPEQMRQHLTKSGRLRRGD